MASKRPILPPDETQEQRERRRSLTSPPPPPVEPSGNTTSRNVKKAQEAIEQLQTITDRWLMENGFRRWESNRCVFEREYLSTKKHITLWKCGPGDYMVDLFGTTLKKPIKSEGELRRLLDILGFEQKTEV